MMWVKGQPWRVVDGLQKLNEQVRAYAPRAVPPATDVNAWGSIANDAHSSSSDHYPHFYSPLGSTAVVCARDFPHAPALGLDGGVVTEALRISRDSRIGYIIFNRRITGPNHDWQWDAYTGSDPHDTHFHVSSVHTAVADDTRPWTLPAPKGPDVLADERLWLQQTAQRVEALLKNRDSTTQTGTVGVTTTELNLLKAAVASAGADPAAIAAALAANEAFITAIANAVGASVKDQFGPAFDDRIRAAARQAVNDRLDDNSAT